MINASDKILRDKAFNFAKNPKYDGYQRELASMVYKFFDKKSAGSGVNIPLEFNEQLAKRITQTNYQTILKKKSLFWIRDNIWGTDLADMQLISKFNKAFRFLLCVIDIFSKHAWVVPLKDKKGISVVNAFQKILKESDRKPKKYGLIKEVNFTIILLKNG